MGTGMSYHFFRQIILSWCGVGHFHQIVVWYFKFSFDSSFLNIHCDYFKISIAHFILFCYEGELVDAVVPFMGESITDGTLAAFLKSKLSYIAEFCTHENMYLIVKLVNCECVLNSFYDNWEQNQVIMLILMSRSPKLKLIR